MNVVLFYDPCADWFGFSYSISSLYLLKMLNLNKAVAEKSNTSKTSTELSCGSKVGLHSKCLFKFSKLLKVEK